MRKSLFFLVFSVIFIPVILFSQQIGTGSCSLIIYATNELAQSGVVYINGKDVGTLKNGKLELFGFEVKKYSVVIDAPNIDKYEIEITFDFEYEVKELKFSAKPPTRTVRIETVPSGAKLYLDDKDIGTSPWEGKLDVAKSYKLRAELQGYRPLTQTISIPSKGDTLVFTLQLIENKPPEKPSDPSPSDGQTNVSLQPILSWQSKDPEGDKIEYDLYFGTTPSPELIQKGLKEAKFTVSKLESGKTYYWKVIARDELGKITEGPIWKFTTINNPPSTPRNPQPGNNEKLVPINVTLKWESTDPDGDKVTFDVYFGTNSNPPLVRSNIDVNNYTPGQLNYNTTYYWKVVAKDNKGAITEGPVWIFRTINIPPTQPSNPNPQNGAQNVPKTLTLTWESKSNIGGKLKFDIYFGKEKNPPLYKKGHQENRITIEGLESGTEYYWKIVTIDEDGTSSEGPVWSFKTINQVPSKPILISPTNASSGIPTRTEISWKPSQDPDGDEIIYYVYIGTNPRELREHAKVKEPKFLFDGWNAVTYYWQIKASDEKGGVSESEIWQFTTKHPSFTLMMSEWYRYEPIPVYFYVDATISDKLIGSQIVNGFEIPLALKNDSIHYSYLLISFAFNLFEVPYDQERLGLLKLSGFGELRNKQETLGLSGEFELVLYSSGFSLGQVLTSVNLIGDGFALSGKIGLLLFNNEPLKLTGQNYSTGLKADFVRKDFSISFDYTITFQGDVNKKTEIYTLQGQIMPLYNLEQKNTLIRNFLIGGSVSLVNDYSNNQMRQSTIFELFVNKLLFMSFRFRQMYLSDGRVYSEIFAGIGMFIDDKSFREGLYSYPFTMY